MLVVIANNLPDAVRGRMKLWFVEPYPNVFISGVKDSVADNVVDYLYKSCSKFSGLMIFKKISKSPGYKIIWLGKIKHNISEICGLQLIKKNIL